jgi:hypothetical protein
LIFAAPTDGTGADVGEHERAMAGTPLGGAVPGATDPVARAHVELLSHNDLQFDFTLLTPPTPPGWLKALGELLKPLFKWLAAAAPAFNWLFWIGLGVGVCAILWFLGRELLATRFPGLRRKAKPPPAPAWRPSAASARTLLDDADRLAADGRYGEAVRLILFRSIEDIDARWPHRVSPALTSRDIAGLAVLPEAARSVFSNITHMVEISLFGGRALDAAAYAACRGAYQDFALSEAS